MKIDGSGAGRSKFPPFQKLPPKKRKRKLLRRRSELWHIAWCLIICVPTCTTVCLIVDRLLGG